MVDKQGRPVGGLGRWAFAVYALLIALAGVALVFLGGKLIAVGGTAFYAILGVALVLSLIHI